MLRMTAVLAGLMAGTAGHAAAGPLKIFILAGQSNIHAGYIEVAVALFIPFVLFQITLYVYLNFIFDHDNFFADTLDIPM